MCRRIMEEVGVLYTLDTDKRVEGASLYPGPGGGR